MFCVIKKIIIICTKYLVTLTAIFVFNRIIQNTKTYNTNNFYLQLSCNANISW